MQLPSYTDVPSEFRTASNPWRKCAEHIIDTGQTNDVRLVPRAGINADMAWDNFKRVADDQVLPDFHKKALAAWILYSGFERCFYEYD